MAKTNLQLKTLAQATGKSITTTLTYVNPNANSATLKTFGQKLNALTTNSYVETDRVQTINVDTEDTPKIPTTLQLTTNTATIEDGKVYIPITIEPAEALSRKKFFGTVISSTGGTYTYIPIKNDLNRPYFETATTGTYTIEIGVVDISENNYATSSLRIESFQVTAS